MYEQNNGQISLRESRLFNTILGLPRTGKNITRSFKNAVKRLPSGSTLLFATFASFCSRISSSFPCCNLLKNHFLEESRPEENWIQ
jgi:hypothetical protein